TLFMNGPWDHNRLIRPSDDRTAFNFPWDLNNFICIGHDNICIPIEGKCGLMFYKILKLLIMWSLFKLFSIFF
ncbi:hypothetical protein ACQP3F_33010, partial [Escherichia coli]